MFIPMDKQSKKNQKAYYSQQRGSWLGTKPVSVIFQDKTKHQKAARSRAKAELRQSY